ncbi:MAG: hypothetical protein AAF411_15985 [Myxococcota bacterium]
MASPLLTRQKTPSGLRIIGAIAVGFALGAALSAVSLDAEAAARVAEGEQGAEADVSLALEATGVGEGGDPAPLDGAEPSPPEEPPNTETGASEVVAPEAGASESGTSVTSETGEPEPPDAEPALEPVEPPDETPVAPAAPLGEPDRQFRRGRLAYLRCGDAADGAGRCPRDRELEAQAWAAAGAAARCGLAPGTADLRLSFQPGEGPELRFRDFGDAPIDAGELQRCLSGAAASLRSSLPHSFVLSLRFTLR